jgi:hypothetical protein
MLAGTATEHHRLCQRVLSEGARQHRGLGRFPCCSPLPRARLVEGPSIDIAQFTRNSCPASESGPAFCASTNDEILAEVIKDRPQTVILFGAWANYGSTWAPASSQYRRLQSVMVALKAAGVPKVVLLGPAPKWTDTLPNILYAAWSKQPPGSSIPSRLSGPLDVATIGIDRILRDLAISTGVQFFSVLDALCDSGGCMTVAPGTASDILTWDGQHLTTPGAKLVAEKLRAAGLIS